MVTFKVYVGGGQQAALAPAGPSGSEPESGLESLERRVLAALSTGPLATAALAKALGQKQASGPLAQAIRALLATGWIERTVPNRPNSRLQRYRRTLAGERPPRDVTR